MQRIIVADVLNPNTKPSDRAQLARAWDCLADRKWVLKMKGKPKPVDVSKQAPKPKPAQAFSETGEAPKG